MCSRKPSRLGRQDRDRETLVLTPQLFLAESNIKVHAFVVSDFKLDYYLAADDEQTKKYWMHGIHQAIRKIEGSSSSCVNLPRTQEGVHRHAQLRMANYLKSTEAQTSRRSAEPVETIKMNDLSREAGRRSLNTSQNDLATSLAGGKAGGRTRSMNTASRMLEIIPLCTFDDKDEPLQNQNRSHASSNFNDNVWIDLRAKSRDPRLSLSSRAASSRRSYYTCSESSNSPPHSINAAAKVAIEPSLEAPVQVRESSEPFSTQDKEIEKLRQEIERLQGVHNEQSQCIGKLYPCKISDTQDSLQPSWPFA